MAAAVSTPVIALHAVTRPEISGPYGQVSQTINCYEEALEKFGVKSSKYPDATWFMKVHHPEAMHLITAEQVLEKVKKIPGVLTGV